MSPDGRSAAAAAVPGAFTAVERRALDALDLDGLVDLLRALIAIPSLDGAESPAQRAVAGWMREAGLEVDEWGIDLEQLAAHPDWCHEVERDEAVGVVGWVGGPRGGRDLLLNGHIDVVPVGDPAAWTDAALRPRDPRRPGVRPRRRRHEGRPRLRPGRRACRARCRRAAARTAQRGQRRGRGRRGDRHAGDTAARAHRARCRHHRAYETASGDRAGRLAHVPRRSSPASPPTVACARRASARWRSSSRSSGRCGGSRRSAVASRPPRPKTPPLRSPGTRALPCSPRYRLPWPIEVGTVHAGDWASSVPDTLVAEGRYGVAVGEDPAAARRVFEAAVARAAAGDTWLAAHPPRVEWWGGRFDPAVTAADDPVVAAVSGAAAAVGGAPPPLEGVTYGADMRLLVERRAHPDGHVRARRRARRAHARRARPSGRSGGGRQDPRRGGPPLLRGGRREPDARTPRAGPRRERRAEPMAWRSSPRPLAGRPPAGRALS